MHLNLLTTIRKKTKIYPRRHLQAIRYIADPNRFLNSFQMFNLTRKKKKKDQKIFNGKRESGVNIYLEVINSG